jgi:hypothetical protein
MKTAHTPGPWYKNGYYYQRDAAAPTGRRVMLCGGDSTLCEGFTINAANTEVCHIRSHNRADDARLIAAAPDLLAALEDLLLVANVRIDDTRCPVFDHARAVIAKARGEA